MQSLNLVLDRGLESRISDLLTFNNKNIGEYLSGLLIGHRTASTIYVVHLARNIQIDGSSEDQVTVSKPDTTTPPSKGSGKKEKVSSQKNESSFDEQSILQHVRQTIRMLPGGLDIVGFFVGPNKKNVENTIAVNKSLRSAYKLCTKSSTMCGSININENSSSSASDGRMILLTLDGGGSNKKPISTTLIDCRPDAQSTAPSSTIPFSYQNLRWRGLSTRLLFDIPLVVPQKQARETFLKQFVDSTKPWCRRLWTATATINGQLRDEDEPLISSTPNTATIGGTTKKDKGKKTTSTTDENEFDIIDFYFHDDRSEEVAANSNSKLETGSVSMHIRGTMYCLAFVHQKSTIFEAIQALKIDALRSLYSRCELHYDGMSILEGEELDPVAVHQFPRRVFVPLLIDQSILSISDYLFEGDVKTDAMASFKDYMDLDTDRIRSEMIEDKFERIPSEKALENLLRGSSSMSATPEGSIDDLDRLNSKDLLDEFGRKKTGGNKNAIIYFLLTVIIGILAYLGYFLFGK